MQRFVLLSTLMLLGGSAAAAPDISKREDVTIYEDAKFYSSFPSIVRRTSENDPERFPRDT